MRYGPKIQKFLVVILAIGWLVVVVYRLNSQGRLYHDTRLLMGTFWEVTSPDKRAGEIVFSEVKRLEELLSRYIKTSEISRLNRSGSLEASPDTFYIIKKSKEFWQRTCGSFDIAVAPLIDLWGFKERDFRIPRQKEINAALRLIGSDKIILRENGRMVKFKLPGMEVDLGGIAKGYALDCAVRKLKDNSIESCLINAGGQVYALGNNRGRPWKIGIRNGRGEGGLSGRIKIKNRSAATSGDYEQFFFRKGKRYSHIIDPRTGYPADSGVISVTVEAVSGTEADALSTAAFILGKTGADKLAKEFPGTGFHIQQGETKE